MNNHEHNHSSIPMTHEALMGQIQAAKMAVAKSAQSMPHIYPEYNAWKHACDELARAKAHVTITKAAWDAILNGK